MERIEKSHLPKLENCSSKIELESRWFVCLHMIIPAFCLLTIFIRIHYVLPRLNCLNSFDIKSHKEVPISFGREGAA